jgi:CRP/FNR family cyclic AMP-dependent transcriptional regulator
MTPGIASAELAEHRFFRGMPAAIVARLADCAERVTVDKGEQMLTEGELADSFYVIQHGRVAVGIHTPNQGLAVIQTVQGGDVLGWSWLFPPHRWRFDAVALRQVQAIKINVQSLRPYLEEHPRAALDLASVVAGVMEDRLQSAGMRLLDLYGKTDDDAH